MSLEDKSRNLKSIISTFDTEWFLGKLNEMLSVTGSALGQNELRGLSSPYRQLYYLAGLIITSPQGERREIQLPNERWNEIKSLLREIELEYQNILSPERPADLTDEQWTQMKKVAVPTFLTYFNQGHLNFEEQRINWISDLYSHFDELIVQKINVTSAQLLQFYENLDHLTQFNFRGMFSGEFPLRANWKTYSKIVLTTPDGVPDFIMEMNETHLPFSMLMTDRGIVNRFKLEELVSESLPLEAVTTILSLLSTTRSDQDFLYYTGTRPANPIYLKPIVQLSRDGLYQVVEIKQILHSIENLLDSVCLRSQQVNARVVKRKGKLLENNVVSLFQELFNNECKIITGYYVDGCEQDILILWKKWALIIESKGYSLREPLRNPSQAFERIKDDFKKSVGYGYSQSKRVESKFINGEILKITDETGRVLEEIDTTQYEMDFSIVVTIESFGPIQTDLSIILALENDEDVYPWAVKYDDLEVFIRTLIARKQNPKRLFKFLAMRESLHGKVLCNDELEICGGFLKWELTEQSVEDMDLINTSPDMAGIFDEQYNTGLGLKNEKFLAEKKGGKHIFL